MPDQNLPGSPSRFNHPADIEAAFVSACRTGECVGPLVRFRFPRFDGFFVYALVREGRVMYVGLTTGPVMRTGQHIKTKGQFDEVLIAPVEERYAAFIERALINAMDPPWNKLHATHGPATGKVERLRPGRIALLPEKSPDAWIVRNGDYWRLSWRDGTGRTHGRGLGSMKKLTRREAEVKARRLIAAGLFASNLHPIE